MKKLLFLAILALAFAACEKTEIENPKSFRLSPDAKIFIKPASKASSSKSFKAPSNTNHLSPIEIVKLGTTIRGYNDSIGVGSIAWGFAGKDTISETPAFLRWGTDIISLDGLDQPYLVPDFIYAYDCVIEIFHSNTDIDTIAYIPNEYMRAAEDSIKTALIAKDTVSVYSTFQNAFRFVPITGSEYRALKSQNNQ